MHRSQREKGERKTTLSLCTFVQRTEQRFKLRKLHHLAPKPPKAAEIDFISEGKVQAWQGVIIIERVCVV